MKYRVTRRETIVNIFEVEADSPEQAHARVSVGPIEEVYLKDGVTIIDDEDTSEVTVLHPVTASTDPPKRKPSYA